MAGLDDKIAGKAKEFKGKVTDNEADEAEGKARYAKGDLKDKAAGAKKRVEYEVEKRV
jgi:uncharacterized protein YjbJ (UPF0337 family)